MSVRVHERLLLIDTCGETAGVALCAQGTVLAVEEFATGRASAEIVAAVRRLLDGVGWEFAEMDAVGVVSGPGSFTGVRTGLAAAKGFCEATGVRMVAVSRLEVLATAAGVSAGVVALDAGRGEVFVREVVTGQESVRQDADVQGKVVVAEVQVGERLKALEVVVRPLHVTDALQTVRRRMADSSAEVEIIDANYVRGEGDIYRKVVAG